MRRARAFPLAFYAVLLLIVGIRLPPAAAVGDAAEYLAYAVRFTERRGPAIPPEEIPALHRALTTIDPAFAAWDIAGSTQPDRSGQRHFVHFWLYPAIASPFVLLARGLGADPRTGFTLMHACLLLIAFHALSRRVGATVAWFLLAGPVLWWLDKPHPEVYLVALLAMAFAWWADRPGAALTAAGLAGAQVAPLAIVVPLLAAAAAYARPDLRRDARFWMSAAAGAALAVAPVVFYLWRFGEPSLIARVSAPRPPWGHLGTELFDLTLGLVPNWPLFGGAVIAAAAVALAPRSRVRLRPDLIAALAGGVVLLFVFPQIGNVTHGGTPGMSRYGLWLVPLAVPLFAAVHGCRAWQWTSLVLTAVSVPWSIVWFHPARPEFSHRPTRAALWVWRHHPAWSTPLPRVFVNALRAPDETAPVATAACTKALLIGRGEAQGMWPRACAPGPVPAACRSPGVLCYANRAGSAYTFTEADSAQSNFRYDPDRVWPKNAEAGVLSAMALAGWPELLPVEAAAAGTLVESQGARVERLAQGPGGLLIVLRDAAAGARVTLRPVGSMQGVVVDGDTGDVVDHVTVESDGTVLRAAAAMRTLVIALKRRPPAP